MARVGAHIRNLTNKEKKQFEGIIKDVFFSTTEECDAWVENHVNKGKNIGVASIGWNKDMYKLEYVFLRDV